MSDPVTKPAHYTQGAIECIDAIRAALTPEEFRGFCKGNAIKYAWREQHKGGDEDLRKAGVYLSWAVTSAPPPGPMPGKYAWHCRSCDERGVAGALHICPTPKFVDPTPVESDDAVMANGRWFRTQRATPGMVLNECAHGRNVMDACGDCYTAADRVRTQLAQAKEGRR